MAFDFNWHDNTHSIVRVDIHGDVEWSLLYDVLHIMMEEISEAPYRVDVIFNDIVGMPESNPIPHLKTAIQRLTSMPHMGLLVTASNNKMTGITRMMIEMVMRTYGVDMSHYGGFQKTLDESIRVINNDRAKISPVAQTVSS